MNKELTKIKDELQAGRPVISFTSGVSMEPLLHDKRKKNATHVLIMPVAGICKVGDMPLVFMEDGRYILHRIVRVDEKDGKIFYQTRGDNCIGSEYVSEKTVLGIVEEIYYKNKTVKVTDEKYNRYVRVWMRTYSIRKVWMRGRNIVFRGLRLLKRIFKSKGGKET